MTALTGRGNRKRARNRKGIEILGKMVLGTKRREEECDVMDLQRLKSPQAKIQGNQGSSLKGRDCLQ